jgi:hypothetical protein
METRPLKTDEETQTFLRENGYKDYDDYVAKQKGHRSAAQNATPEDPASVLKTLDYRCEEEFGRDRTLDRNNPADIAEAQRRALNGDEKLMKRYKAAFTVQVSKAHR